MNGSIPARRMQGAKSASQYHCHLSRVIGAGLLAASLVLPLVTFSPARAEAPLETPGADSITFNRSEGRIGKAVLNDSGTDRTTVVADNSYFGVVRGMTNYDSSDPNQRSVAYRAGYSQDWLDANVANNGDYWSYVTRGVAWDYHMAAYYHKAYYGDYTPYAISTSTTSALGYKPNNPGTVSLNSTFLIGAVRHNNFPIYSQIHWVHSSFDIRIGDLEESFPFDQHETDNDTDTTAVRRKGGPYTSGSPALPRRVPARRLPPTMRLPDLMETGIASRESVKGTGITTSIRTSLSTIRDRRACPTIPPNQTTF